MLRRTRKVFWLIRVRVHGQRLTRLMAVPGKTGGEAKELLKSFFRANRLIPAPRKYRVGDQIKKKDLPADGELAWSGGEPVYYLGYE